MITVKVARLGTTVQTVALEDGAIVQDALDAAGLTIGGSEDIRINESNSSVDGSLESDDIVTLIPKVKGGQKIVKVAKLGSTVKTVALDVNATVQDALDAADVSLGNEDVRINGSNVALDSAVGEADLITVVPKVKGGK